MNLPRRADRLGEPRELRITGHVTPAAPLHVPADRVFYADPWGWSDDSLQPAAPQPAPPPRPAWLRWWKVYAVAAVPVGAVLAYLIAVNAALFAVCTALTVIAVCGGAGKVSKHCRGDH